MTALQCLLPCSQSPGQPKQPGGGLKQGWHTRGSCLDMQTMTAKSARMPCHAPIRCWPKSCCGSVRAMAECTLRLPRLFPPSRPYLRSTESTPPYGLTPVIACWKQAGHNHSLQHLVSCEARSVVVLTWYTQILELPKILSQGQPTGSHKHTSCAKASASVSCGSARQLPGCSLFIQRQGMC